MPKDRIEMKERRRQQTHTRSETRAGSDKSVAVASRVSPATPDNATVGTGPAETPQQPEIRPGHHGSSILANGRWTRGVSGNPAGRPKNEPLLFPRIRKRLGEVCPYDKQGRLWIDVLLDSILRLVMLGNAAAIREVCERIDGKVKDEVEMDVSVNLRRVQFMTDAELEEQARKVIDITATATSKDDADDTGGDHDGGK
ncbi:MAG: DUF5681 domain-containing protein [Acidobacteriota bacterium]|jgi:hypothetical protein